ncbi:ABC transporter substrate-binding protein [Microbacterium sp. MEC084]|uniref:ABC transporter substrate-binding protein n=1 Tax=Microbacterium sp. MEC084 TaxID=1963027 RepID=UPI00106F140E|nr:ABC transporter substrate-binding protein [Microbacterium sp. MEC084]MCD1269944.1 ABC transporter substrate-binding protein [Microbacterium sp. MEC084]
MRNAHRTTLAALAATVTALVLAGCSGTDTPSTADSGPDSEPVSLKVGYIPASVYAYFWQAQDAGYFEDAGLEVELVPMSGGGEIIPALQSGSVQFGISDAMGVINAVNNGIGIEYVTFNASQTEESPIHSVVVKDPSITSAADLNGKTVATNASFNTDWTMMRAWLRQGGADLDSITFLELPFPDQLAALDAGTIDAAGMLEPFVTSSRGAGLEVIGDFFTEVQSPSVLSGVAATNEYVEQNPDVVERFVEAVEKAVDDFNADPQVARDRIAENTEIDPALVAEMNLPVWSNDTDPSQMQFWIDAAEEEGIVETDLDPTSLIWTR